MSGAGPVGARDPRVRDWLEALRELGVSDLPKTAKPRLAVPAAAEPPARGAPAPARAGGEQSLFDERTVLPEGSDPGEALRLLRDEEIGDCRRCALSAGRRTIVFGSGNPHAQLMFIGEGPGADEDAQGLPFVGRAGRKLTEMIEKGMGIPRDEVYIANIVKCRPPDNRDPKPDEIAACQGFLFRQIDIIRPKVIVALGKPAANTLLGKNAPISALRGRWWTIRDTLLLPTFHPAYLLRSYTPENRRTVWEDLMKVKRVLDGGPPD